jgi:3'-5' exoribonuclease
MKSAYVADLAADQPVVTYFLVFSKEIRSSAASGNSWLQMELGDRTGTVEGKMWRDYEQPASTFDRDDVVKVQGRVKLYRGKLEIAVDKIRRAEPDEYKLEDLIPHTEENVDQLFERLQSFVSGVANPWLKRLLDSVLADPEIASRLRRAPAAKAMHHAYLGGLIEHIVSLCGLCRAMAQHYPDVDGDLLVAAAVLHDIGKLDELAYDRAVAYTTPGQLLGHIMIGYEYVSRRIDAIENFPAELKTLVQHLLASHHGRLEFGSPKLPQTMEAVLFNYLDELDSRMGAMRHALDSPGGEGEWTGFAPALERRLLRVDRYVTGGKSSSEKQPGAQIEAQSAARSAAKSGDHPQQLRLDKGKPGGPKD